MRLTVLTDNAAGGRCAAEHGLSYLIESRSGRVLFDTGHSDIFLRNARQLGIDIDETDTVVLSHGHWDHGDGLRHLRDKRLICHPGVFIRRYHGNGEENIGLSLDADEIHHRFQVVATEQPLRVNDEITFLGAIPRENDFESQSTSFVDEDGHEDFIPDDSALAIVEDETMVVVSGCAHSGICNIIEHARNITGIEEVAAVFGGFHLRGGDRQTEETIAFFHDNSIRRVHPAHCTQLPALAAFHRAFGIQQVKTGMVFEVSG